MRKLQITTMDPATGKASREELRGDYITCTPHALTVHDTATGGQRVIRLDGRGFAIEAAPEEAARPPLGRGTVMERELAKFAGRMRAAVRGAVAVLACAMMTGCTAEAVSEVHVWQGVAVLVLALSTLALLSAHRAFKTGTDAAYWTGYQRARRGLARVRRSEQIRAAARSRYAIERERTDTAA